MSTLPRPQRKIVTLCGSTRFKQAFTDWNARLTLEGCIVLSVGLFEHADGAPLTPAHKAGLDALHKCKIAISDEIVVRDVHTDACEGAGAGHLRGCSRSRMSYHRETLD